MYIYFPSIIFKYNDTFIKKKKKKYNNTLLNYLFSHIIILNIYIYIYVETRFATQAQDIWDFGPVSPVQ